MTENDVRRIVRSELNRILVNAGAMSAQPPASEEPGPIELWVRTLPPGTSGTPTGLLGPFHAATGLVELNAIRLGRGLAQLAGRLVSKSRTRSGRSLYTVLPWPLGGTGGG